MPTFVARLRGMMDAIGVRDLKVRASEILRRVRENGDAFEVTYHGRVIARLVPVSAPRSDVSRDAFWAEWDELAADIGAHWPRGLSAVEAVRGDRREL